MKETMETLKCKAVHVAAGAAQTARLVALISKKKFAILAEQDKIRRCYTQLGKVYYKDYVTDEEPDDAEYDPLCAHLPVVPPHQPPASGAGSREDQACRRAV